MVKSKLMPQNPYDYSQRKGIHRDLTGGLNRDGEKGQDLRSETGRGQ
jgi:hypothetical protein